MWAMTPSEEYLRDHKRFVKKHPRELLAVLDNLDTVMLALNNGARPLNLRMRCIHDERKGLWAIDQSGGDRNLMETRLYVFADQDDQQVHVISLTEKKDKRRQSADIEYCRKFIASLKKRGSADGNKVVPNSIGDG